MPGRRREERREERQTFGARGDAVRFQMREKLMSIGDDSWIEDSDGRRAFKVNGKALRVRKTLILEDPSGRELFKIRVTEDIFGQNIYERAIVDVLVKSKGHVKSKIW